MLVKMSRPNHLREAINRFEDVYALPLKDYVKEAYAQSPLITAALVVFALTSLTPVVSALALAVFTVCLSVAACIVALIGIALCLAVFLSTTLISSTAVAFLGLAIARLRHRSVSTVIPHTEENAEATEHIPAPNKHRPSFYLPRFFSGLSARFRASAGRPRRRRTHIIFVILACEVISRLRLPRWLRYKKLYRTLLGTALFGPRGQRGHPLQRLLSLPFFLTSRSFFILSFFLRVLLSKSFISLLLVALVISPRLRRGALRRSVQLGRAAYTRFGHSELAEALKSVPWKQYTAMGLEQGGAIARSTIALLIAFLRALEETAADAQRAREREGEQEKAGAEPVHMMDQSQDAYRDDAASVESYEMVPTSTAEESTSTLRARTTIRTEEEE
ncbi:hypothetical protein C8F01DRAFT_1148581 [Mycena amicta]|nr:hypothetical protein C8F01DRAFT_1148581 [Mycena amicta]